jgi:predicted metallopeptidase
MSTLNLTAELERLIADITAKHESFSHIDVARVLVCVNNTRSGSAGGVFAKIHPLRFPSGDLSCTVRRGRHVVRCTMPDILHLGREILYVIYFMIPRFLDRSLSEKLVTIFHELYHISPACDGDIRRFAGRNYAHGGSVKSYNRMMEKMVDEYMKLPGSPERTAFLEGDMHELRERHRAIVGRKMPMPKIRVERK